MIAESFSSELNFICKRSGTSAFSFPFPLHMQMLIFKGDCTLKLPKGGRQLCKLGFSLKVLADPETYPLGLYMILPSLAFFNLLALSCFPIAFSTALILNLDQMQQYVKLCCSQRSQEAHTQAHPNPSHPAQSIPVVASHLGAQF